MKKVKCHLVLTVALVLLMMFSQIALGQTTLRFWTHVRPENTAGRALVLHTLIEEFEKENPGVKVIAEVQPWVEMSGKLMASHAAGNPPDVSFVHSSAVDQVIRQGALADLNPFIAQWPAEEREEYYSSDLWNVSVRGNEKYLMSIMQLAEVIIYRKDLFAEYGIDPNSINTWEAFIEAGQILTRDRSGKSPTDPDFNSRSVEHWGLGKWQARNTGAFVMVDLLMQSIDGSRAIKDDFTANWTTPTGLKAFQMWVDLITKHQIQSPRDLMTDLSTSDTNFATGREAMHHLASFRIADIKAQAIFDPAEIGSLTYPGIDENSGAVEINAWYVGIAERSKNKELAWKFVEKLTGAEADLLWAIEADIIPARRSTLSDPFFATPSGEFVGNLAQKAMESSFLTLCPPVDFKEDLALALHEVVNGTMTTEEALQKAANDYNKRLADVVGN